MASIHKKTGSPYWYIFYRQNGKQYSTSTETVDRDRAEKMAKELESVIEKAEEKRLAKSKLMDILNQAFVNAGFEEVHIPTVKEWFDFWYQGKITKGSSKSTLDQYSGLIKRMNNFLGTRVDLPLQDITVEDLQGYFDKRVLHVNSNTIKQDRAALSNIFDMAKKHGKIQLNPVLLLTIPDMDVNDAVDRIPFTDAEIDLLVEKAHLINDEWPKAILFAYYLAARLTDVCRLSWDCVDFNSNTISYKPQKTRKRIKLQVTPMNEHLRALVDYMAGDIGGNIFPKLAKTRGAGRNGLSMQFKRIMELAGIDRMVVRKEKGRNMAQKSFHSIKHTTNSDYANQNVPVEVRQDVIGHRTESINENYTHRKLEFKQQIVNKLKPHKLPS